MVEEMMDWDAFDRDCGNELNELVSGVKELVAGEEKLPAGEYEIVPEKLNLNMYEGRATTTVWCRVVDGKHKGRLEFVKFSMGNKFTIYKGVCFLRALKPDTPETFDSFGQWNRYLARITPEVCSNGSYIAKLTYAENKNNPDKPYPNWEIVKGPIQMPADYKAPNYQ